MRIRLVDIDSTIPNLALMKLSAHYKKQGHQVSLDEPNPEKVFVSCIFPENAWKATSQALMFPGVPVEIGGSGVSLSAILPLDVEGERPDYDLYPSTASLGFTTRGCIRACPFCIVSKKEGTFRRAQHVKEFLDPRFKDVVLLDNNILADKAWFMDQTDYLNARGHRVFSHGLDARLMDREIAERLRCTMQTKDHTWFFAWDNIDDEEKVHAAIVIMKQAGINTRNNVAFYVLVGFNSTIEQDLYRCRRLKEWDSRPFVMKFKKERSDRDQKKLNALARWANRANIFFSIDFADYVRTKGR